MDYLIVIYKNMNIFLTKLREELKEEKKTNDIWSQWKCEKRDFLCTMWMSM